VSIFCSLFVWHASAFLSLDHQQRREKLVVLVKNDGALSAAR
jgi:hypothetical protein